VTRAAVITIDGPSASGKGTVAVRVAEALGFSLLDSGALYRVLGIAARKQQLNLGNHQQLAQLAADLKIEFGNAGPGSVWLNGEDVSLEIRTDAASKLASEVGAIPAAREALLQRQLEFRQPPGLVADGRDMGTIVFPNAELKIFLTASPEERAQRRYKQLREKGFDVNITALLQEVVERDERDRNRSVSPLKPADDAIIIDCTELSINEVQKKMHTLVSATIYSQSKSLNN
jgi:cytidylate kinase